MSTFGEVKARIADELDRNDLGSQIVTHVRRAVDHYGNLRWWFNETVTTLTSTTSNAYVDIPSDFVADDALYIRVSGYDLTLVRWPSTLAELFDQRPTSNTRPGAYLLTANRFELDSKPDAAYLMPLRYIKRLSMSISDGASNAWTTEAEDLISARAMRTIYDRIIRQSNEADRMARAERDAYNDLCALNEQRVMTGHAKPWS